MFTPKLSGVEVEDYRQPWIISLQKKIRQDTDEEKNNKKFFFII